MNYRQPLVSIIIPVYKTEEFLKECLDSVIGQTHQNLEILVIDDGSPDRSYEILKVYAAKDARVRIFKKINGGLSDTRNYGMERCSGDYVYFVDSDDIVRRDAIEILCAKAEATGSEIVMGSHAKFKSDTAESYVWPHLAVAINRLSKRVYHSSEIYGMFFDLEFYAWSALYSREFLLKHNQPFPKGLVYEDVFWHSFHRLRASKITAINEILYFHRLNSGSITARLSDAHHMIQILQKFEASNKLYLQESSLLSWKFRKYKRGVLTCHIKRIVEQNHFIALFKAIVEVKKMLADTTPEIDPKNAAIQRLFINNPAWYIYLYYSFDKFVIGINRIQEFIFDIRIKPKRKIAYIMVLGQKINIGGALGFIPPQATSAR